MVFDPTADYVALYMENAWSRGILDTGQSELLRRGYPAEVVQKWYKIWSDAGAPEQAKAAQFRQRQVGLVARTVRQPAEIWSHWEAEAAKLAVSVSVWLRLQCSAKPAEVAANEPAADPVHGQSLWSKIHGIIGDQSIKASAIKGLAKAIGVEPRSIHAALGSRVASKRMVRIGDEYRPISKGE